MSEAAPARPATVLVVDDDDDLAWIVGEVLAAEGFVVRRARDGVDGLRLLEAALPDVVLMDVEMPHLTGPELSYRMLLRDLGMDAVPVVLVSGVAELDEVARRVGTPYHLAKPYDLDELLTLLRRALDERRAPNPPR